MAIINHERDQHRRNGPVGVFFLHLLGTRSQRTLRRGHIVLDGSGQTAVEDFVFAVIPAAAQRIGRGRIRRGHAPPEGEVVVGQQAQLGRRESQRVEKRLFEGFALGHEQRVLQPLHTRPAKAVVGVVSEHRKADKRHVLLIGGVEHLPWPARYYACWPSGFRPYRGSGGSVPRTRPSPKKNSRQTILKKPIVTLLRIPVILLLILSMQI